MSPNSNLDHGDVRAGFERNIKALDIEYIDLYASNVPGNERKRPGLTTLPLFTADALAASDRSRNQQDRAVRGFAYLYRDLETNGAITRRRSLQGYRVSL